MRRYFLEDVDFVEAVHRCLDGHDPTTPPAAEPQEAPTEKTGNPLLQSQIDDTFTRERQNEVERTMKRERLLRSQEERFLPGQYVRFTFMAIREFVTQLDQRQPLVLGGLLPQETQRLYVTAKLRRHRWFPRVLKTRNPVTLAVGWRRYQTLPVYGME